MRPASPGRRFSFRCFGDGAQTMDFVHVADVTRANLIAAESPASDVVFNIASGVETSLNELASLLLSVMQSPLRAEHAHDLAYVRRLKSGASSGREAQRVLVDER